MRRSSMRSANVLGDLQRADPVGAGQDDREFVSAVARRNVACARQRATDRLRHRSQTLRRRSDGRGRHCTA